MTEILVVDDSNFMRRLLARRLGSHGFDVITAENGREAVDKTATENPDVITMDVRMPEMGGIEAVERIMSQNPTPIIMVSAHTAKDADPTLDALRKGAVDFITKPDGDNMRDGVDEMILELVSLIDQVENIDVSELAPGGEPTRNHWFVSADDDTDILRQLDNADWDTPPTILLGASTGGPKYLEDVASALPLSLHARVVVVQHMPSFFTGQIAERLNAQSSYTVFEAESGGVVNPGEIAVAPGDQHLRITGDVDDSLLTNVTDGPPVNSVKPSIDVTFQTAAEVVTGPLVGVVMTGMGDDGVDGVKAVSKAGGTVIAQDEETSAIFGIPQRAIESGCVDKVLAASDIVPGVVDSISEETRGDYIHG